MQHLEPGVAVRGLGPFGEFLTNAYDANLFVCVCVRIFLTKMAFSEKPKAASRASAAPAALLSFQAFDFCKVILDR